MKQTKLNYLLDCLQEECAEVIQIVGKIKRFGLDDVWKNKEKNPHGHTNEQRLLLELNDIFGVTELMEETSQKDFGPDFALMEEKKKRVLKYMEYSRGKGLVE